MKYEIIIIYNFTDINDPLRVHSDNITANAFTVIPNDKIVMLKNVDVDKKTIELAKDLKIKAIGGDRVLDLTDNFLKSIEIRDEENNILFFWRRKESKVCH